MFASLSLFNGKLIISEVKIPVISSNKQNIGLDCFLLFSPGLEINF